jgi:hypothetical protein
MPAVAFRMKRTALGAESRRCLCCNRRFIPDPRTRHRQLFCSDPACKKVSKSLSQKYWHAKPGNQDYWRGPEQVQRVRDWRKAHDHYWKRSIRKAIIALQDEIAKTRIGTIMKL